MMRRTSKRATTSKKSQAINARATPGRKYSGFDGTEGESPLNDPTKSQFEFLTDNKGEKVLAKFNAQLSPWTAHKRHGNTVYLASGLYDDDSDIDSGDSDYYTSDDETEDELEVNSVTKTTVAEPNENKRKSVRVSTNGSINRNSTHRSSTHDGLRIRLRRTPAQTTRKSLSRKSGQHRGSRNGESVRLSTKFNNPAMLLEETYEEGQGSIAEIGSSQTYIKSQANQHSFKYTPISHSNTYAYQPRVSKSVPTRRKNPDPRHKLEEMKQSQKGGSGRPPEIPLFPSAQTTQALPRGVDSLKADGASNMPSVRTPPPQRQAPRPPADPDQISIKYHASSIKSYNSDSLRSQRSTNSDGETSHRHGYNPGESNTSRVSGLTSVGRPSLTPSMGPGLGYHMPPKRKQSVPLIKDIWNNANAPNSGSSSLHSSMSASSGDIANKINGKTITADPYKDLGANTSIDTPQSYLTYDSSPSSTRSSTRTIGSSPSVPKRKRSLDSLRGMLIGPKNRTSGGTTERRLSIDAQGKRNVGRVYNIGSASDDETVKSGRAPEVYDMTVSLPELGVNVVAEACSLSDPLDINNIRSGTKLTVQVHKFRVCEGDTTVMKRRKLVFMMNHEAQTFITHTVTPTDATNIGVFEQVGFQLNPSSSKKPIRIKVMGVKHGRHLMRRLGEVYLDLNKISHSTSNSSPPRWVGLVNKKGGRVAEVSIRTWVTLPQHGCEAAMDAHKYNGLQRLRKFSVSMFKGWAGTNNTERVNTPPQISSPDQRWRHNAHPQPNTPSGTHLGISNVPHAQQPAAGSRSVPVSPETPRRTNEIGLGDPLQRNELVAKPSNMLASLRGKKVSSKHPNDAHMSGVDRLSKHTLLSATSSATTFGPRELPEGSVSKTRPALLPSGGY